MLIANRVLRLRSTEGAIHFTRRERVLDSEGRWHFLPPKSYDFTLDNGFTCQVPEPVWEELRNEYLDRTRDLKYGDAFIEV